MGKTNRRKAAKSEKTRDLSVSAKKSRNIRGGVTKETPTVSPTKTPLPSGPVPIPYPN